MNIKKAAMMLTIMLITILSASSFYILTGEAELDKNITVNSTQTEDGIVKGKDYEKVYGEGPYTETSGTYNGQNYYIRYTGAKSHKTVIDLDNADKKDDKGIPLSGYDVTKEDDGTIKIFGKEIKTTYKMFSKRKGGTNTEITRVFVPGKLAIDYDDEDNDNVYDSDLGIASNTFYGWNTDTEKDVIYHTYNITASKRGANIKKTQDRTTKISKDDNAYPHVTIYVYLGDENVIRTWNDLTTASSYNGQYNGEVRNVFVSNSLDYPTDFFWISNGNGTSLDYALLDTGETWAGNKMGLGYMFRDQTNLQITNNFKLPSSVYQGSNTGSYDNEYGFRAMFLNCSRLGKLPTQFVIPKGINNVSSMFYNCKRLSGIIEFEDGSTVSNTSYFLYSAGTSVSKYKDCNTPIIIKYPVSNSVLDNYSESVYTPQTTSGKVTMIPITNNNDTTQWEKIYEDGAPNYDEGGAYYIRYKGTDTTVYMDSIERDDKGAGNKDFDIEFSAGTNNPCILNTKLRSTYKMFSKRNENDTEIERVFLPSTLAIKGDQSTSGNIYNNNGIASNTFSGYENSTVEKDVIYHSGKVSTDKGGGLNSTFNRIKKIDETTYPYVAVYVYLGTENFSRKKVEPSKPSADGWDNNHSVIQYAYTGAIPNVYVSKEIDYLVSLFSRYGFVNSKYPANKGSTVNKVLLDENGEWDDFSDLLSCQQSLDLSEKFSIINKKDVINIESLFWKTNITHLPKNFSIPLSVTRYRTLFANCSKLTGTIDFPTKITENHGNDFANLFLNAGTDTTFRDSDWGTPIVVRCHIKSAIDQFAIPTNTAYVHKIYYEDGISSQSSSINAIVNVQEATNKIVIEDCTEEISVKVNEVSNQKLSVEDETDYVSVTVNKNVEENKSEEDEVQE